MSLIDPWPSAWWLRVELRPHAARVYVSPEPQLRAIDGWQLAVGVGQYSRSVRRRARAYDERWFERRAHATRRSADVIAPFVAAIVRPESVVDLGCGTGSWLAAFGVDDFLGVDAGWVPRRHLEIPEEKFVEHDLSRPFSIERTFDLALSVEVGEHLSAGAADVLVESLTRLAPAVMFSAAIPFQGGTGHVNPQWPSYWADRFGARGYASCDVIRPAFWCHPHVRFAHAQNLVLYVRRDRLVRLGLQETPVLPLVHPRLLERLAARPRRWSVVRNRLRLGVGRRHA